MSVRQIKVAGADWSITVDLAAADRVQEATGVDVLSVGRDSAVVLQLHDDLRTGAKVLWAIVEPAAIQAGKSKSEFLAGLDGDTITQGLDYLIDSLIDFFPRATRTTFVALRTKANALREQQRVATERILNSDAIDKIATAKLEAIAAKMEQLIDSELAAESVN